MRYYGRTEELLGKYAWYTATINDPRTFAVAVATLKPNDFGLFDMLGNAVEWCNDRWPTMADSGEDGAPEETVTDRNRRVVRGGCFGYTAGWIECAGCPAPLLPNVGAGFRVARSYNYHAAGQQGIGVSATGRDGHASQSRFSTNTTRPIPAPATLPGKGIAVDLSGGVKLEMVLIPAGELLMGSPDSDKDASPSEKPQHPVQITKPFCLAKYLLTQEQWEAVMGGNPSFFKGPKNPVEQVSGFDCQQFLEKLNAKVGTQGGKFVLPTEAQWEYAGRAGSKTRYCFGDEESGLGEFAWYGGNSGSTTHPVGEKKPNAWGLHDMHGNVREWCAEADSWVRAVRGGGCFDDARRCRSAYRLAISPNGRGTYLGLRVARVAADN
jgi:formylglycine-generating enzyme required for sulfatase activity